MHKSEDLDREIKEGYLLERSSYPPHEPEGLAQAEKQEL